MMKTINNIKYIGLLSLLMVFIACNDEEDVIEEYVGAVEEVVIPELTAGSADFSNYVSLGASFTAGFTDNALFIASQENSFPNMLAMEFAKIGGGAFTQPMMNDNFGGLAAGGARITDPRLVFDGAGPVGLESLIGPVTVTTDIVLNNPTGPFNNMGVPGAKSFHLLSDSYGDLAGVGLYSNPYFVRMASSSSATMLGDAAAQSPSFFTLSEIGGNDVLVYATGGGAGVDQTGNYDPTTYGNGDLTDPLVFADAFNAIVTTLTAGGAKGVVTNVPYITSLPHFTTVTYNVIPLDGATADVVNGAYAEYNGGLQQLMGLGLISAEEVEQRTIMFEGSQTNAVVIEDEYLTDLNAYGLPNYRQATADDLFVLPSSSFIGTEAVPGNPLTVNGVAIPLADQWVLVPQEQEAIITATDAYNQTIEAVAGASADIALVDLNSILQELSTTGITFGDFTMNADLVLGGAVSLDGIHLTARGYSYMAYEFLKAMDEEFGSNFIESGNYPNPGDYPTNYSPLLQ